MISVIFILTKIILVLSFCVVRGAGIVIWTHYSHKSEVPPVKIPRFLCKYYVYGEVPVPAYPLSNGFDTSVFFRAQLLLKDGNKFLVGPLL